MKQEDDKELDEKESLFCVSFYISENKGFVSKVEMDNTRPIENEDLELCSSLLYSIFSGDLESDIIGAITKLYLDTPEAYPKCVEIIKGWADLKAENGGKPAVLPTQTLKR